MALQEDKRRLLQWLAAIGGIILMSQLMGYHTAFSSNENDGGGKSRHAVLSREQAEALRATGGRRAAPGQQAQHGGRGVAVGPHSVLLSVGPEAPEEVQGEAVELPRVEQLVVAIPGWTSDVDIGRSFVNLCIFNKLAGKELRASTRLQGAMEFSLGAVFPLLSPGARSSLLPDGIGSGQWAGRLSVALDDQQGTLALSTGDGPEMPGSWAVIGHLQDSSIHRIIQLSQQKQLFIKDCREL